MKKFYFLHSAILCFISIVNAQTNFVGAKYKTFGVSNADDNVVAIAPLSSGCATTGTYIGNPFPIDGGTNLPNKGDYDIFVLTHNKNLGNPVTAFSIAGTAADVPTDIESNSGDQLFLSGRFTGSTDFEYLNTTNALTTTSPANLSDGFLAKYDLQGNLIWNITIKTSGADEVTAIAVDGNDLYITGEISGVCSFPTSPAVTSLGTANVKSWFVAKVVDNGSSAQMAWVKLLSAGKTKDICVGGLNDIYVVSSKTNPGSSRVEKFTKAGVVVYDKSFANEVLYSKAFVNKGRLLLGGEGWGPYMRLDPANPSTDYSIGEASAEQYLAMYNEYDTLDCSLKQTHLDLESPFSFFLKGSMGGLGKDLNGDTKELHTSLRVSSNGSYKDLLCKFDGRLMLAYNNSAPYTFDVLGRGFATVNTDNAIYMVANYRYYNYINIENGGGSGVIGNQNFVVLKMMDRLNSDFTFDKTHVQADDEVEFTNNSTGIIDNYKWYFGDGANPETAIGIGPHKVTYSTDGPKQVALKITGEAGADSIAKQAAVYVYKKITADFSANVLNPAKNQTVTFSDNSSGDIDSYVWLFGEGADPELAYGAGPHSVTYSSDGDKTVSLTISKGGNTQVTEKTNYIQVQNVTSLLPTAKENTMDLNIYPVPAKEYVIINSNSEVIKKAELADMNGKTIKAMSGQFMSVKLLINDVKAGTYILKVTSDSSVNVHPIIIE